MTAARELAQRLTRPALSGQWWGVCQSTDLTTGIAVVRPAGGPGDGSGDVPAFWLGDAPRAGAKVRAVTTAGQSTVLGESSSAGSGPWRWAQGSVAMSLSADASQSAAVTFPAGRFTLAPLVQVSRGANGGRFVPYAASVTASGFTAGVASGDGSTYTGTVTVYWRAEQATPWSAAG